MSKTNRVNAIKRHVWTESEDKFLIENYANGITDSIACRLNLTAKQVRQRAWGIGLSKNKTADGRGKFFNKLKTDYDSVVELLSTVLEILVASRTLNESLSDHIDGLNKRIDELTRELKFEIDYSKQVVDAIISNTENQKDSLINVVNQVRARVNRPKIINKKRYEVIPQ
jgi:hypothetical protein